MPKRKASAVISCWYGSKTVSQKRKEKAKQELYDYYKSANTILSSLDFRFKNLNSWIRNGYGIISQWEKEKEEIREKVLKLFEETEQRWWKKNDLLSKEPWNIRHIWWDFRENLNNDKKLSSLICYKNHTNPTGVFYYTTSPDSYKTWCPMCRESHEPTKDKMLSKEFLDGGDGYNGVRFVYGGSKSHHFTNCEIVLR